MDRGTAARNTVGPTSRAGVMAGIERDKGKKQMSVSTHLSTS